MFLRSRNRGSKQKRKILCQPHTNQLVTYLLGLFELGHDLRLLVCIYLREITPLIWHNLQVSKEIQLLCMLSAKGSLERQLLRDELHHNQGPKRFHLVEALRNLRQGWRKGIGPLHIWVQFSSAYQAQSLLNYLIHVHQFLQRENQTASISFLVRAKAFLSETSVLFLYQKFMVLLKGEHFLFQCGQLVNWTSISRHQSQGQSYSQAQTMKALLVLICMDELSLVETNMYILAFCCHQKILPSLASSIHLKETI